MRTELKLILWVTAGLALCFSLFHATANLSSVDSEGHKASAGTAIEPIAVTESDAAVLTAPQPDLPPIPTDGLHLFPAGSVAEPAPAALAQSVPAPLPVLKGIVSSGGLPRAIFASAEGTSTYIAVGTGDTVQGFAVREVAGDFVVLASASGELSTLRVRGAGEAP